MLPVSNTQSEHKHTHREPSLCSSPGQPQSCLCRAAGLLLPARAGPRAGVQMWAQVAMFEHSEVISQTSKLLNFVLSSYLDKYTFKLTWKASFHAELLLKAPQLVWVACGSTHCGRSLSLPTHSVWPSTARGYSLSTKQPFFGHPSAPRYELQAPRGEPQERESEKSAKGLRSRLRIICLENNANSSTQFAGGVQSLVGTSLQPQGLPILWRGERPQVVRAQPLFPDSRERSISQLSSF